MDEKNEVKTPGEQSAEEKHTGYVVLGVFFSVNSYHTMVYVQV